MHHSKPFEYVLFTMRNIQSRIIKKWKNCMAHLYSTLNTTHLENSAKRHFQNSYVKNGISIT